MTRPTDDAGRNGPLRRRALTTPDEFDPGEVRDAGEHDQWLIENRPPHYG